MLLITQIMTPFILQQITDTYDIMIKDLLFMIDFSFEYIGAQYDRLYGVNRI